MMRILCIFFFLGGGGVHHKIGLYLGVISMHFRVFALLLRMEDILGCLKFLIFFFFFFFLGGGGG